VRSVAQAHLAKLGTSVFDTPPTKTAAVTPTTAPLDAPTADNTTAIATAMDIVQTKAGAVQTANKAAAAALTSLTAIISKADNSDDDVKAAAALVRTFETEQAHSEAAMAAFSTAAADARKVIGASAAPAASAALATLQTLQTDTEGDRKANAVNFAKLKPKIAEFNKGEAQDPEMILAAANSKLATGNLTDAKRELDLARAAFKKENLSNPSLDWSYGQLWDKLALREKDPAKHTDYLRRAKASLDAFAATGSGKRAAQAKARSAEISDELAGGK
jgi:hypothetical protein